MAGFNPMVEYPLLGTTLLGIFDYLILYSVVEKLLIFPSAWIDITF
jgi:hypothetical protein